ncbi:hypothetical protein V1264_010311 [Littorina saxatilis]|uniref:Uncharacterized protein n=1 Tax=Littorina saxatilis TaxID=31220 RepID=A0AAN9G0R1_9CAEN
MNTIFNHTSLNLSCPMLRLRKHPTDDFSESLDRLMSTNWCQCANCVGMGLIRECRCCQEIPEMESLTVSTGVGCITDHPGFRSVCLDHYVLETCYHWYNQQYGRAIQDANE